MDTPLATSVNQKNFFPSFFLRFFHFFVVILGMKHVRGILLFGPPGTGKTLMARQIGQMLNAREPKIVNGPSMLEKRIGESEANIRKLFADAEEEWKRAGANSGLHIIICDEIDAICKQRGSMVRKFFGLFRSKMNENELENDSFCTCIWDLFFEYRLYYAVWFQIDLFWGRGSAHGQHLGVGPATARQCLWGRGPIQDPTQFEG